jgi:hypothetical protein
MEEASRRGRKKVASLIIVQNLCTKVQDCTSLRDEPGRILQEEAGTDEY